MKDIITFEIDDFFTNAGIVGLTKILEQIDAKKEHYQIFEQKLEVEKDFLLQTDLTHAFFKTMIHEYQEDNGFTSILKQISLILEKMKQKDSRIEDVKDNLKWIKERLNANSYQSAYQIIIQTIPDDINFYDLVKSLTSIKEKQELEKVLNNIYTYLMVPEVNEIFYMKNLAYAVISHFWENKSFLNRSNSKKDMARVHQKEVEEPFKKYLQREKDGEEYCAACGEAITASEREKFTFLKDMEGDLIRKKSDYWNFVVDKWICPKCMFLYTLIPLGFKKIGNHFIFVNNNDSIYSLVSLNKKIEITNEIPYYAIFNMLLLKQTEENLKKLDNIEVISKYQEEPHYRFDIVSKEILLWIKRANEPLEKLSRFPNIKIQEVYYNLYTEVLTCILKNRDLYDLMINLLVLSVQKEFNHIVNYVGFIYKIQLIKSEIKLEKEVCMNTKNQHLLAAKSGKEIREVLIEGEKDDSSLIGISYKMFDALKKGDSIEFIDIIGRLCNSTKKMIPGFLIDTLSDVRTFRKLGCAFVIGFRGGIMEMEGEEENE